MLQNNQLFQSSCFLLVECLPRHFMEKDIPQIQLTWFCGKDFLHDALPCSGFNAQICWLFSSQWSSLSVDECATGLDNGHELTAGLCDGPASRKMGAFVGRGRNHQAGNGAGARQTSPADGYPPHDSKDSCITTPCDQSHGCDPSCSGSFWQPGL